MTSFAELLAQGAGNAWLFIPSAILLGALHGLEPGHSKTMMAAFIIAIRGTVRQAVMLGIAATLSHTAVVWAVALVGLSLGDQWRAETTEPYFQLISAIVIVGVAAWMIWRTWSSTRPRPQPHDHHHHDHDHPHDHDHDHAHDRGHTHALGALDGEHDDDHAREHAQDIRRRFDTAHVTDWQVILFGLTGGLIPCPAAITVLLLCLQLKQVSLGIVLVLCFSIGLAITLVAFGAVAALSVKHVGKSWSGFDAIARRAPYLSGALILGIGLYIGYEALLALQSA